MSANNGTMPLDRGTSSSELLVEDVVAETNATAKRPRILTLDQLDALPQPTWLVRGVLPGEGVAVLYGAPGDGKTFVALDLAKEVSLGGSWGGRSVEQGTALYIAAEGTWGIQARTEALRAGLGEVERKKLRAGFTVVGEPVQFATDELQGLIGEITDRGLHPALIIVDTLARCLVGGDENSAQYMGAFVEACDHLSKVSGALVLVLHHGSKSNQRSERGSGALRGGADAMLFVRKHGDSITVEHEKLKDGEEFDPFYFRLIQVELQGEKDEQPRFSCRLEGVQGSVASEDSLRHGQAGTRDDVLAALEITRHGGPLTGPELVKRSGRSSSSVQRVRKKLQDQGLVLNSGTPERGLYRLSDSVAEGPSVPSPSPQIPVGPTGSDPANPSPSPTTPLRGGDGEGEEVEL